MLNVLKENLGSYFQRIDRHVGARIRLQRLFLGLSQDSVAESMDLSFQQIQKYEWGVNRISASKLYALSKVLSVDVSFFFQGLDDKEDCKGMMPTLQEEAPFLKDADALQMPQKETLDLIRTYYQIHDPSIRKKILDLMKSLPDTLSTGEVNKGADASHAN